MGNPIKYLAYCIDVAKGRRLPSKVIEQLEIADRFRGKINLYERWGERIAKTPLWRELNGDGPSAFYDLEGLLIIDNYNINS